MRKSRTKITDEIVERIKELVEKGNSVVEIAEELDLGTTTVRDKLKSLNLTVKSKKDLIVSKIIELHSQGLTVQEIFLKTGKSLTTIRKYLTEKGLETNTKFVKSTDIEIHNKIKELVELGKTNFEISQILNISTVTALKYTNQFGLETNSTKIKPLNKKEIHLTDIQLEVLYGSLLGDMCLSDGWKNVRPYISQGGEQELYFDHKCEIFDGLLGKISKTPRYDKRTDKWYNKYAVRLLANPVYTKLKEELYPNHTKTVSIEWLNKITPRGLAFWFMDDGSYNGSIATNSFTYNEHLLIQEWFLNKYNIKATIQNVKGDFGPQYLIYILAESRLDFEKLIFPFMIPSMYYKLKKLDPNSVNCGELLKS